MPALLERLNRIDQALTARIVIKPQRGKAKYWVELLRRFSEAGSYGVGWIVLFALVGILSNGVKKGAVAAVFVVAMLTFNTVIKEFIRRPRPTVRAIDHAPKSWSMPSAHTSMAMVGAATMQIILPNLAVLWWSIAVLLGASRVLLGMHFLGDVLVGALLGLIVGLAVAAPIVAAI